jgi:hypothetical protein
MHADLVELVWRGKLISSSMLLRIFLECLSGNVMKLQDK